MNENMYLHKLEILLQKSICRIRFMLFQVLNQNHSLLVFSQGGLFVWLDEPKQAAAVPYYASCPLFPEDFQRIDVHNVEVYSTNFN